LLRSARWVLYGMSQAMTRQTRHAFLVVAGTIAASCCVAWNAGATSLSAAATLPALAQNYSPAERVALRPGAPHGFIVYARRFLHEVHYYPLSRTFTPSHCLLFVHSNSLPTS